MGNSTLTSATPPTVPAAAGEHRQRSAGSFWIDVYSFLALGLILAYFGVAIFVAGELLDWSIYLIRHPIWAFSIDALIYIAASVICVILLMRVVPHLIYAAAALVTSVNEKIPEAAEGIELPQAEFPRIFQLVADVAADIGSPAPDEIRVSSSPETLTAELRRFGIVTQRRLVMVLSLPQLAVLSVGELQVILAHELSHLRDTWVTVFFSRFVAFLQRSVAAMESRWWRWIDPIYWLDRIYYRISWWVGAPIERHHHLRADRASASAYGGDLAARTLLKDFLLQNQYLAAEASHHPRGNSADDNVFAWFRTRWHDFSPDGQDYLLRRLEAEQKESFWDPDPTYAQRVKLMRSYPDRPTTNVGLARDLFADFPEIERRLHRAMFP